MVAALVIFLFWSVSNRIQKDERQLAFSDFMAQLERGYVGRVTLTGTGAGTQIAGTFTNGQAFRTFAPPQIENLVNAMLDQGVEVTARDANSASWLGHIISWTPIVIMIAFLSYFMRSMQEGAKRRAATMTPWKRRERRLELKARFFEALSSASADLTLDELVSSLGKRHGSADEDEEISKAAYELLSDGVALLTEEKKYRIRTVA